MSAYHANHPLRKQAAGMFSNAWGKFTNAVKNPGEALKGVWKNYKPEIIGVGGAAAAGTYMGNRIWRNQPPQYDFSEYENQLAKHAADSTKKGFLGRYWDALRGVVPGLDDLNSNIAYAQDSLTSGKSQLADLKKRHFDEVSRIIRQNNELLKNKPANYHLDFAENGAYIKRLTDSYDESVQRHKKFIDARTRRLESLNSRKASLIERANKDKWMARGLTGAVGLGLLYAGKKLYDRRRDGDKPQRED